GREPRQPLNILVRRAVAVHCRATTMRRWDRISMAKGMMLLGFALAAAAPAAGQQLVRVASAPAALKRLPMVVVCRVAPRPRGGVFAAPGTVAAPLRHRRRAIEFIGDSHTVGYGNTSPGRACTEDQVWATTDTSRGIAPLTAARYAADYQVNAISGRGVVRNYN